VRVSAPATAELLPRTTTPAATPEKSL